MKGEDPSELFKQLQKQNFELKILSPRTLKFSIDELSAVVTIDEELLNRGPFGQPLLDFEIFKQALLNLEDGLIEWPNGYAIAIDELEHLLNEGLTQIEIS
jgi:hypothetical protein